MKVVFGILLFLISNVSLAGNWVLDKSISPEQVALLQQLKRPFANSGDTSPAVAFAPIENMMKADPLANALLQKINTELNAKGIGDVADIVSFCDSANDDIVGLYTQSSTLLETRLNLPGVPPAPWSDDTMAKAAAAYSFEIITDGMIDFLLISERPSLCISKRQSLRDAYDTSVHELTHFQVLGPFKDREDLIFNKSIRDNLTTMVNRPGGEFDAYVAGVSAQIRLLKKAGVVNSNAQYPQFDVNGNLVDGDGFRAWLLDLYKDYYDDPEQTVTAENGRIKFNQWRIDTLRTSALTFANSKNNSMLANQITSEITNLTAIDTDLAKDAATLTASRSKTASAPARIRKLRHLFKLNL